MFKCGDKVVCPPHGAALIVDIQEKCLFEEKKKYFILKPFYGQLTIMIPVDKAREIGLRKVVSSDEIKEVFKILRNVNSDFSENWSTRLKENWGKISNGDIMQVAEVVRDLSLIKKRKSLSVREKDLLRQARRILISEIVYAQGIKESEAVKTIDSIL